MKKILTLAILTSFASNATINVSSKSFKNNGELNIKHVANVFGCNGQNISPALSWDNLPAGTKSIAITAYDPDAPTGSGFWHWIAYNIPANTKSIKEGEVIKNSKIIANDYGKQEFGGACPPQGNGMHHYQFTVHALKVENLEIPQSATSAIARFMINAHTIEKGSITATYSR